MMNNELYIAHHGVQGQKWGVRRYQNYDGTLTEEGKTRLKKYNVRSGNVRKIAGAAAIASMISNPMVIAQGYGFIADAIKNSNHMLLKTLQNPVTLLSALAVVVGSEYVKRRTAKELKDNARMEKMNRKY